MIFQSVLLQMPQASTCTSASYGPISGSGSSRISVRSRSTTNKPFIAHLTSLRIPTILTNWLRDQDIVGPSETAIGPFGL